MNENENTFVTPKKVDESEQMAAEIPTGGEVPGSAQEEAEANAQAAEDVSLPSQASNVEDESAHIEDNVSGDGNAHGGKVKHFGPFALGHAPSTPAAAKRTRSIYDDVSEATVSADDFDAVSVDEESAESVFEGIQAKFTLESTSVITKGEDTIVGEKGVESIYSKRSEIVKHTQIGFGDGLAKNHPMSRENGKLFIDPGMIAMLTAAGYIRSSDSEDGQDEEAQYFLSNSVLFNELDPAGNFLGSFRLVRTGLFLVQGIEPVADDYKKIRIGYVKRKKVGTNEDVNVPVYVSGDNMIHVLEVTPVVGQVLSATAELQRDLCSNEIRHEIAKYKGLADKITNLIQTKDDIAQELVNSPDFNYRRERSTLFFASGRSAAMKVVTDPTSNPVTFVEVNMSCRNDYDKLIELFSAMEGSEMIGAVVADNTNRFRENLLAAKALEGKMSHSPHFTADLMLDQKANYGNIPSLLSCLESYNQSLWESFPAFMTKFGLFWKELKKLKGTLEKSVYFQAFLEKMNVLQTSVDDVIHAFEIGKLGNGGNTSADLVKDTQQVGIVLGFNPNDLIAYNENYTVTVWNAGQVKIRHNNKDAVNTNPIRVCIPYLCCGYAVVAQTTQDTRQLEPYFVAPRWLQFLVKALQSYKIYQENVWIRDKRGFLSLRAPARYFYDFTFTNSDTKFTAAVNGKYVPWTWHHTGIQWIDWFLLKCFTDGASNKRQLNMDYDSENGFLRWNVFIKAIDTSNDGPKLMNMNTIAIKQFYDRITKNDALYPDSKRTDPAVMETLHEQYLKPDPYAGPIAVFANGADGNAAIAKLTVVFEAKKYFRNVDDFSWFETTDGVTSLDGIRLRDLLWECAKASPTYKLLPMNANGDYFLANASDNSPVKLRMVKPTKKAEIRADVLVDGADSALLGYGEEANKAFFAKDNWEWIGPYDYFVVVVRKPVAYKARRNDIGDTAKPNEYLSATAKVCPAIEIAKTTYNGKAPDHVSSYDWKQATPHIRIASQAQLYNVLYDVHGGTETVITDIPRNLVNAPAAAFGSAEDIKNSRGDVIGRAVPLATTPMATTFDETRYMTAASLPSLYTGKLNLPTRITYVRADGSDSTFKRDYGLAAYSLADTHDVGEFNIIGTPGKIANLTFIGDYPVVKAYMHYDVYSDDRFATKFNGVSAVEHDFKDTFVASGISAGDTKFYDRAFFMTNDTRPYWAAHTDDLASLPNILATANMAATPVPSYTARGYVPRVGSDIISGAALDASIYNVLEPVQKDFVYAAEYDEFMFRHGFDKRLPIIPYVIPLDIRMDNLGGDKPSVVCLKHVATIEPTTLSSRSYVNAYRDFEVGQALIHLNDGWARENIVTSQFAEKFKEAE